MLPATHDDDIKAENRRASTAAVTARPPIDPQAIPPRRLYSIGELCQLAHLSRATAWRRRHEFDLRKIGRRTFVTAESVEAFIAGLPKAEMAP
jgi:hypothetical protein